jgi:hypothetical protein
MGNNIILSIQIYLISYFVTDIQEKDSLSMLTHYKRG